MRYTSKDLLRLEHKNSSTSSPIESKLQVCNRDSLPQPKKPITDERLVITPVPKSLVLGKVKDFLGIISEANKRLEADAKNNTQDFDIEALTGNESEVIEMDLMLGIADIHTPEAMAAAESAISGYQPEVTLASSSSEAESEYSSDDDDSENEDVDGVDDNLCSPIRHRRSKSGKDDSLSEATSSNHSKKRSRIVEL